jgi:hypothetical protein
MEDKDLMGIAIANIEEQLNRHFAERKMSNTLRSQIAGDMAVIAGNAFRAGYYAHAKEAGIALKTSDFQISDYLTEVTWRIQEAGK